MLCPDQNNSRQTFYAANENARGYKSNANCKLANGSTALFYEDELSGSGHSISKIDEAKIVQFAKKYGFRMRFYRKGLCAIFDKWLQAAAAQIRTLPFSARRRSALRALRYAHH